MSDQADEEVRIVERHVAQLGEHFQSVRIIATRHQDGNTITVTSGSGNWYAQVGSVRDWVTQQDEYTRIAERRRHAGDDE